MSKLKKSIGKLLHRNKNPDSASSDIYYKNEMKTPNSGVLILIVEDSKTAQKVLKNIFIRAGYDVLQAMDGESGIALAQQYKPSLILMDVVMPGINGFQATRMIRKDPEIADIPVIIVSGNEKAGEQFWISEIGADHYLTKPLSSTELFSSIDKLLSSGASTEKLHTEANDVVEPDVSYEEKNLTIGNELKVLVVDDSKTVQYLMKKMLMQRGYEVLQAYDAQTGIILAKKNMPALIIMDVVMPGMNGFQATRHIKKDSQIAHIPIVIISGNRQATDQFWATRMGAAHFLSKPFSRKDMFLVIEDILHIKSRSSDYGLNSIVEPDNHAIYET
ncbi:MAG: response regulator [Gammaproteobacteria bacterium]|nr:response regulator [Gammaproteobacteria bacterium]